MSAHQDSIQLDAQLYARMKTVHEQLDSLDLDPEQQYLVERYYTEFTLAGRRSRRRRQAAAERAQRATVDAARRVREDAPRRHQRAGAGRRRRAELDGLTAGEISAAARPRPERGLDGKYVITLVLPTGHPYLASLTNRETRRTPLRRVASPAAAAATRTTPAHLLLQIVALRAERARLLGSRQPCRVRRPSTTPPARPRRSRDLLARSPRPPPATRAPSRRRCRRASRRATADRRSRRRTGRTTPSGCARRRTTSTRPRCGPTSSSSGCSRTASSSPRPSSTASRFTERADLVGLPPGRPRLRGAGRGRLPGRPLPRSTSTPATPSAAAPG